jgi:lipoate-protein ligase A
MRKSLSTWRLLDFTENNAAMNMAIDEAILINRSRDESQNTVRFYTWNPSAVSIGFFQSIEDEVDLGVCKAEAVDVVRRSTGGGAVFHDRTGEVTYSMITDEKEQIIPKDILKSYQIICGGIVEGLGILGVSASFQPVNDIVVGGKKISGNAQTRRLGVVLQHGTVLVDSDLDKMFRLLKVSNAKIRGKMISSAEERVTTINREMLRKPSLEEVAEALGRGFEKSLDITLTKGQLTDGEMRLAKELCKQKYSTQTWTHRR